MKTYPNETINPNVPDNVFLLAETSQMSGEIVTTYYIDQDGMIYKVSDWADNKPQLVMIFEICRITGDTYNIINGRFESWQRQLL